MIGGTYFSFSLFLHTLFLNAFMFSHNFMVCCLALSQSLRVKQSNLCDSNVNFCDSCSVLLLCALQQSRLALFKWLLYRPVWAQEHCRISPPRFLAECRKKTTKPCGRFLFCCVLPCLLFLICI